MKEFDTLATNVIFPCETLPISKLVAELRVDFDSEVLDVASSWKAERWVSNVSIHSFLLARSNSSDLTSSNTIERMKWHILQHVEEVEEVEGELLEEENDKANLRTYKHCLPES